MSNTCCLKLSAAQLMTATFLLCTAVPVLAGPTQEVDLASTTAWTLDGVVKPVPGGGWNAQGISRTKDNVVYQRSITLPTYPAGSVVKVLFGAVNHGADVYLDNTLVTTHLGPMMPFDADITSLVTPGGTHTLKVTAYSGEHYGSSGSGIADPTGIADVLDDDRIPEQGLRIADERVGFSALLGPVILDYHCCGPRSESG